MGTSPASPTPTSSSSGAICVPPTSSSSAFSSSSEASSVGTVADLRPARAQSSRRPPRPPRLPARIRPGHPRAPSAQRRPPPPQLEARPRDASRGSSPAGWRRPPARAFVLGSVAVAAVLSYSRRSPIRPPSNARAAASADADPGHEDGASVASDLETPVAVFRESPKTSRAAIAPTSTAQTPARAQLHAPPPSSACAAKAVQPPAPALPSRGRARSQAERLAERRGSPSP